MAKLTKTASELKRLVAAEFYRTTKDSVEQDRLVIVTGHLGWLATLPRDGSRVDEEQLAALGEISRHLAARYDLAGTVNSER